MDPLPYQMTMETKPEYLYVQAGGTRNRATVKDITVRVFTAAREQNLSKVLIDIRDLEGNFGFLDIYFFVTDILKEFRGKGVDQVAFIDVRRSTNPKWFLEPVAQYRGFNFRVFPEEESARQWLVG